MKMSNVHIAVDLEAAKKLDMMLLRQKILLDKEISREDKILALEFIIKLEAKMKLAFDKNNNEDGMK